MEKCLYQNDADFFLLDYSPSHSEIVFRTFNKDTLTNLDIFFKGVKYIQIIPKLTGIKIFKKNDEKMLLNYGSKNSIHFIIEDNLNQRFSIIAYFFCVSSNSLEILQTSLGDFFWSKENLILFDSDEKGNRNV